MKQAVIEKYLTVGQNIFISGPAGTGKTTVVKKAAETMGMNLQYYSASTMDPYAELLGIPVPDREKKVLDYYKPEGILEAEVVFFDEANRASLQTINAMFELTQFGTVNGEKLKSLKAVVVAINPVADGYNVQELDTAFVDRFDVFLEAPAKINYGYFSGKFGKKKAQAATNWWNEYHSRYTSSLENANPMIYISPRRLDKMLELHGHFPTVASLKDSLPPNATANVHQLHDALTKPEQNTATLNVQRLINMSATAKRRNTTAPLVIEALSSPEVSAADKERLKTEFSLALSSSVGAGRLIKFWLPFLAQLSPAMTTSMQSGWAMSKRMDVMIAVNNY